MNSTFVRHRLSLPLAFTTIFALTSSSPSVAQQPSPGAEVAGRPGDVLAIVNGAPITLEHLNPMYRMQVRDLQQQAYELQRRGLEELILQRLVTFEANRQGITVEQLLSDRIDRYVRESTPEEVEEFIAKNKENMPPIQMDELKRQIATHLKEERRRELIRQFVEKLKGSFPVTVNLVPPRVPVNAEGIPLGAAKPQVNVVVFTDFTCPQCAQTRDHLLKLTGAFPEQVRVLFRFYPVDQMSPRATPAAVAASCANRLGEFWAYHDRLFANQDKLSPDDLVNHAIAVGIDQAKFTACVNAPDAAAPVQRDLEQSIQIGVTLAPTVYINGRPVMGAQPYEVYHALVEEELTQASMVHPPTGVVPPPKPPGGQ